MSVIAFGTGWGETTRSSRPRTGTIDGDGLALLIDKLDLGVHEFFVVFGTGLGENSRQYCPRTSTMDGDRVGVTVPT